MFGITKARVIDAAKVGAIVVAAVALAESFGIMAKLRGIVSKTGVASAPIGEAPPEPIILAGY